MLLMRLSHKASVPFMVTFVNFVLVLKNLKNKDFKERHKEYKVKWQAFSHF